MRRFACCCHVVLHSLFSPSACQATSDFVVFAPAPPEWGTRRPIKVPNDDGGSDAQRASPLFSLVFVCFQGVTSARIWAPLAVSSPKVAQAVNYFTAHSPPGVCQLSDSHCVHEGQQENLFLICLRLDRA